LSPNDIISSGILELYVTGAATREEILEVEAWMQLYPEVRQEVEAIRESIELMVLSETKAPSPSVKEKLFAQINALENKETEQPTGSYPTTVAEVPVVQMVSQRRFSWVAAASVLLLLGSAIANLMLYNKVSDLEKENSYARAELAQSKDSAAAMANYLNVIQSKYSELVGLTGQQIAPDAAAKVYWIKNTGEVYIDPSNLPPAPAGKQYQFWGIVDGKPVDGGMIELKSGKTYQILKMKSFGKADAFAITLEKEGGSPTPDLSQLYVMGKI
jgi:anti-sigma-K factor RskA